MHLDSMIATNAFTEKDLQIFGGIASQAAVAIHNSQLARKIEQEAKTRAQFQRLLSPNLVDQVVQGKLQLEKGGALSEVTLLFSDIRGFTSMSESRAPQEIVRMLNEYFELMVDVIFKYEGTLDKFVGDEIIALFGAPVAMQNAELKAVQCALDMMRVLSEFNRTRAAEGQNEIKIGIGINTGMVVTGAIGSSRALQYTAIGDAVNTASRLCSVAQAGADHPVRGDLPQGAGRRRRRAAAAGAREGQGRRAARLQRRRPAQPRLPRREHPPGLDAAPRRASDAVADVLAAGLAAGGGARGGALIVSARAVEVAGAGGDRRLRAERVHRRRRGRRAGDRALRLPRGRRVARRAARGPARGLGDRARHDPARCRRGSWPRRAASRSISGATCTRRSTPRGPGNRTGPSPTRPSTAHAAVARRLPAARRGPATPSRPLLVIHGGFWAAGQRGEASLASRRLADLGFTVFDVEYRIAPQPNWQTAVGDVKCAIGWVKQHAYDARLERRPDQG